MTNEQLELHNTLIAILMELQKINKHFDKLLIDGEVINVKEIHNYD